MMEFNIHDIYTALPELFLVLSAFVLLLMGAFKGNGFALSQVKITVAVLFFALFILVFASEPNDGVFLDMFVSNAFTLFIKALIILGSMVCLILSIGFYRNRQELLVCEFSVLILLSVVGMMLMVSANSLLALYIGLEMQSLALYVLAAIHRDDAKSSESGLKYFALGSVASGILLYGCSLLYGFSGTTEFNALASLYISPDQMPVGAVVGMVLVIIGLCFKVSAVPFHMWTPDVYEGAPTPVTAFFAVAPKIAAIALFVRLVEVPLGNIVQQWQQVIVFVSAASMIVGSLGAIYQNNIKRLLAYSSIGHVGFVLMGLAASSHEGVRGVLIYLTIYATMSVGMFACVMMVRHRDGLIDDISSYSGLSKSHPFIAIIIGILMLSMAGIPPFAGFFGKFFVFQAAVKEGLVGLAVIGAVASVIAAFYYLRIIKIMFFEEISVPISKDFQPEHKMVALVAGAINLLLFLSLTPLVVVAEKAASVLF